MKKQPATKHSERTQHPHNKHAESQQEKQRFTDKDRKSKEVEKRSIGGF